MNYWDDRMTEIIDNHRQIEIAFSVLSNFERLLLILKALGHPNYQIACVVDVSDQRISTMVKEARQKAAEAIKGERIPDNGLTDADYIVFSKLRQCDLSSPVSIDQLATMTGHHPQTVWRSLRRLEDHRMISRYRARVRGNRYKYIIESTPHVLSNS